ncbi:facilitated trehalose transporter Tret1 [Anabrus simplex]|uniref:facilitated trehalose transporter Tret1 n=1 Tax=Anabrus simplex TaxID=316456 RepID=UPI0035A2EC19
MCSRRKISTVSEVTEKTFDHEKQLTEERDWSHVRQHLAALSANLATLSGGAAYGWTSPALPHLQRKHPDVDHPFVVTPEEGSWIGALLPLGALFGALPAGFMAEKIGRKKSILLLALPYILGWLCIIFANEQLLLIYIGRFILGLALGATTVLVPQYNEEIAEDAIRGALGVYLDFSLCNGNLLVNLFGALLPFTWFTVASATLPLIFLATFYWMPESPVYLVLGNRMEEATKSLAWLRKGRSSYDIQGELKYLKETLTMESGEEEESIVTLIRSLLRNGLSSSFTTLKTLAIVYVLVFFQQTQGIDAINFYSVVIFMKSGVGIPPNVSSVILCLCQSASDLFSALFVDRIGRKPMLLMSAAMTTVSQATLSVFFHCKDHRIEIHSYNWVPLAAMIVFVVGYTLGFSPLPWLMMNELVPTKMKSWVNSGAVCMNWSLVFLVSKEFPAMEFHLGRDVTYGIFSIMCLCSFVFVFMWVPETKGKSRQEIQEALRGDKK